MKINKSNRSGVALIIVLGLIAVLMIVCVSFSINMRVERSGAANLRHGAVATQVVKGAMAAAIASIDKEVGDDAVPQWYNTNDVENAVYTRTYKDKDKVKSYQLWKDSFISFDEDAYEHIPASFFTPEAETYFPPGSSYKGYATKYVPKESTTGGSDIQRPEWIPVTTSNGGSDVMGRYAFFAMNTSGLLDASSIGKTNRWMGRNPGEIQVSSDLLGGNAQSLLANFKSHGRYDSYAEFTALNGSLLGNSCPFNTFSYEPTNTADQLKIDISSLDKIKSHKWDIIHAFYDCGLRASGKNFKKKSGDGQDSEQARWAYLGLVDFVDPDSDMAYDSDLKIQPWERPATENMPLPSGVISGITFERRECYRVAGEKEDGTKFYEIDPSKCEFRIACEVKFPFVYPFLGDKCEEFKLTGKTQLYFIDQNKSDTKFKNTVKGRIKATGLTSSEKDKLAAAICDLYKKLPAKDASGTEKPLVKEVVWKDPDDTFEEGNKATKLIFDSDWVEIPNDKSGKPFSIRDLGFAFRVKAAAQTALGGAVQRQYPLKDRNYTTPDGEYSTWLTAPYDAASCDVDFTTSTKESVVIDGRAAKDINGADLRIDTWKAGVVVWAEFSDPRFASVDMVDEFSDWLDAVPHYYRTSHGDIDLEENQAPVTTLTGGVFSGFDAAGKVTAKNFTDNPLGWYFDGSKAGPHDTDDGESPLISFMLEHPKVASDFYRMNIDGTRVSGQEGKDTTDSARMKWRAYVKNGPLESVGELGYLPVGPWFTIRLYDYNNDSKVNFNANNEHYTKFTHLPTDDNLKDADGYDLPAFHPVLDRFTVLTEKEKQEFQGRVNLNSLNESVLASAFYAMPIGTENGSDFPPSANGSRNRITAAGAGKLARALIQCRQDGEFETLADLGYIFGYGNGDKLNGDEGDVSLPVEAVFDVVGNRAIGEFEREAVIRNSCGLFTTGGQSYVIVVRGESYSPMFGKTSVEGGSVNAAKTAVAQIWRATEPDEDGNHPIFVQFFKILDN